MMLMIVKRVHFARRFLNIDLVFENFRLSRALVWKRAVSPPFIIVNL